MAVIFYSVVLFSYSATLFSMKLPKLKGKVSLKKSSPDRDKEPIERALVREQVDLFCKIVNNEMPKKIEQIDDLRRKEFNYERMKQHCLTAEAELKRYFPELNSRADVDQYQQLYSVADFSTNSFLMPNGLIPTNRALDELVELILDQLKDLQQFMFECCLTIDLVVPSYEKRSASEYSLLQDIRAEFRAVQTWASEQYGQVKFQSLDLHAGEMSKIATYPQYEDLRKVTIRREKKHLKELVSVVNHLFFQYMHLFDVVCKNGDKLGLLLRKARAETAAN